MQCSEPFGRGVKRNVLKLRQLLKQAQKRWREDRCCDVECREACERRERSGGGPLTLVKIAAACGGCDDVQGQDLAWVREVLCVGSVSSVAESITSYPELRKRRRDGPERIPCCAVTQAHQGPHRRAPRAAHAGEVRLRGGKRGWSMFMTARGGGSGYRAH